MKIHRALTFRAVTWTVTATALASTLSLGSQVHAAEPACPPAEPKQKPASSCPAPPAKKTAAKKTAAKKTAAKKQAAKKKTPRKQAAKKQAAKKQAACRPSRPRPPRCQAAPKKPARKQPAAKKPAAKKPTTQRPPAKRPPTKKPPAKKRQLKKDHGWSWDGLYIDAADLRKVNVYLVRARKAERTITPQVRSIARRTKATVVGLNDRLRSPEAVKRSVARDMQDNPTRTMDEALEKINDSVRYILQWPDASYVKGVNDTTKLLGQWKNANLRWSNTWARPRGYKGINTAWRANNSGHPYELQFHTPKSRAAQTRTRALYEEAHRPNTSSQRRAQLTGQLNRAFATVPCPAGSQLLNGPRRRAVARPV
ncbi:ATP nucleotide 3'-pyrophosphokinase [Streptomyces sp. NPDC059788]|uniref:ATP nucleotide 3'-pyrophosphokinase n=1 Tax=Streptomyces sp. NPDC059788 TaxID=3346948 RepID=UPI003664BCCB